MLLQVANYEGLPTCVHTSRICTFNPRTIARSMRNRRSSKVTNVFSSTSDWYGIVISAFRPRSETLAEVSCPSFSSFTRLDIDPGDTISSDCLTSLSLFNGMFIPSVVANTTDLYTGSSQRSRGSRVSRLLQCLCRYNHRCRSPNSCNVDQFNVAVKDFADLSCPWQRTEGRLGSSG